MELGSVKHSAEKMVKVKERKQAAICMIRICAGEADAVIASKIRVNAVVNTP